MACVPSLPFLMNNLVIITILKVDKAYTLTVLLEICVIKFLLFRPLYCYI